VQQLLASRVVLGEIHFGALVNLHAHEPIIDRDLFAAVQRMKVPRGRQPRSDRLLARLKVLRCGSCGSPLGTMRLPRQGDYPDLPMRLAQRLRRARDDRGGADGAVVWDRVKAHLADAEGRARADDTAGRLAAERDQAHERLDRAVRSLGAAGLLEEAASVETLAELRADRDRRQEALDRLPPAAGLDLVVRVVDDLPVAVRRDLIRATVQSVTVAPSGAGRPRGIARLAIAFY
jgi:hypothetical protein